MTETPRYATLRDYLRVIREHRLLIGVVTIVFAVAGVTLAVRDKPVYESTAQLQFNDRATDLYLTGQAVGASETPDQRAARAAATINTPDLANKVKSRLGVEVDPEQLQNQVSAVAQPRSNLVGIIAQWTNAAFAARVANAYAEQIRDDARQSQVDQIKEVVHQLAQERKGLKRGLNDVNIVGLTSQINRLKTLKKITNPVNVAKLATISTTPVSPKPVRNAIIGGILGLILSLLAALGRDAMDRRFRNAGELRDELGLPLLGHVRDELLGRTAFAENGRKSLTDGDLEAFRIIRSNVDFMDVDNPPKILLVTSAMPGEGKSTVAAALACAYAATGKRTLLVECDLRRPQLAERVGVPATPGLSDYLAGQASPTDVLRVLRPQIAGGESVPVVVVPAGSSTPRPAELLASKRFAAFLAEVASVYDHVILDSPPLLAVVDTLELIPLSDGVVLCVRPSETTREQSRAAKSALAHLPDKPTAMVVTGMRAADEYDYYSYAYGSSSRSS